MRVVRAAALVAHVMHQPLPVIKALSLRELYVWASAGAALSGREF